MRILRRSTRSMRSSAAAELAKRVREVGIAKPYRSMSEFAEGEIIIPDGDFRGLPFRRHRQPAHGLFFDAVDSGRWNRFASVAPQQSGKSLAFYIIPLLYHLFERSESVICGLPTMDIAKDKWQVDIRPAIEASRFREELPRSGPGSKGGTPELISFRHGPALKFMSGGGGDEKRSAFTSRVLAVTEVDKLDEAAESSREADKLKQMEGRLRFYRQRKRVYLECTVSTEAGRIWQEYERGTAGLVHLPCVHCLEFVAPERENFLGWQEAEDEWQAEESAAFTCPLCGGFWEESARLRMLQKARLVHRGESIDQLGNISGAAKRTRTLGFRYSAATNAFAAAPQIGIDEFRAARDLDEDNADTELRQWTWTIPRRSTFVGAPLDVAALITRHSISRSERIRADCDGCYAGADVRNSEIHWTILASYGRAAEVISYGIEPVAVSDEIELEEAIVKAIGAVCARGEAGWLIEGSEQRRPLDLGLIDARYLPEVVRRGFADFPAWNASMGFEAGKLDKPKGRTIQCDGYREAEPDSGLTVEADADRWKERLHRMLRKPVTASTALKLYAVDDPNEHTAFCRQLISERGRLKMVNDKERVIFDGGKGRNHWLDATYNALLAREVYRERVKRAELEAANAPRQMTADEWRSSGGRS